MSDRVPILTAGALPGFLLRKPFAVVHLDAPWDSLRLEVNRQISSLVDLFPDTAFGFLDIGEHHDHVRSINLLNVPACSYYRGGTLVRTLIGARQDIAAHLEVLRAGGTPGPRPRSH